MKIQIDIDDDQLDKAFQENLKWHIDTISKDLRKLTRSKNKLEKYQIEEKDIAVTWLMSQVSSEAEKKFGKNGAVHNLTNLSNRIARNTGASGDDAMSASEIDKRVSVLEVNMDQMIQRFKDNFISNNKKCFEGNGPFKGCDFTSQFIEESIAEFFLEVSSRLEKKTDISEVLKGHVGEIYFDISDATAVIAGDARKSVSTASSTNSNEQSKTNKPATLKVKNDSGVKPKHVSNTVGQHSKPSHASKSQTHAKKTDLYLKAKELPHDKLSNGICWGYCAYLYQNPFAPSQFSSTAHSACKKGFELADQNYLSVRMGKTKKTYMSLCEDTKNDHACKMGYKRGISCFIKQDEDPSARIGALKTTFETYEGEYDEYFQPKEYCMQTTKKFTKNREWEVVKTVDASCKQCGMDEPFDPEDMVMGYCD